MNITFNNFIQSLNKHKRYNEILYNINELANKLEMINSIIISDDSDYVLTPSYIHNEWRYEFYWSEIIIQSVNVPSFSQHVLSVTMTDVEQLDNVIKSRMEKLYIEVVKPEISFPASSMLKCIDYIKTSEEIINDATVAFRHDHHLFKYDDDNLYFTIC